MLHQYSLNPRRNGMKDDDDAKEKCEREAWGNKSINYGSKRRNEQDRAEGVKRPVDYTHQCMQVCSVDPWLHKLSTMWKSNP
jgi:hypothetical protein